MRISKEVFSVCETRTELNLSCRDCMFRDNSCKRFKLFHQGTTPYEYKQMELVKESEENENEED